MRRYVITILLGVTAVATTAATAAARPAPVPRPVPITTAGGLAAHQAHLATGTCEQSTVTCKPSRSGSCTGKTTTTTPPTATTPIRVYLGASRKIVSVPFRTYVQDVLPNEWIPSWDGDALKAGAVAVKTYAWYWMSHFGGYVNGVPSQCFDVTDDADFQVYKAGSAMARTNDKIDATWPVFARRNGAVFQAQYRADLTGNTDEACGAGANGTTLSQNGSQTCNEVNTANKYNVILQTYYGPTVQLSTSAQLRTSHDFQFLATSTRATFRAGVWSLDDGYPTTINFGVSGDVPTVVTDGTGFAHVAVYRPSTNYFYVGSATGQVTRKVHFGIRGDIPVQAQYQGNDHPTQLGVYRPSTGTWYLANPTDGSVASTVQYGGSHDIPVPADYNGDGKTDLAVYRPSTGSWYVHGHAPVRYGEATDVPVPADYDGDGKTDLAVYRPSTGSWYVQGHAPVRYGAKTDIPVTGDYTGDGKADFAVYRPSTHAWYVYGVATVAFGTNGDTPVGAAPYHD